MAPVYSSQLKLSRTETPPQRCCGLDFGSTLIKVSNCYTKESSATDEFIVDLRIYKGENLDEALDFVKEARSASLGNKESGRIIVTGVGAYKIIDELNAAFGESNFKFVTEFECNKMAGQILCSSVPLDVAFYRFEDESVTECSALANEIEASMRSYNESETDGQYEIKETSWFEAVTRFNARMDSIQTSSDNPEFKSFDAVFSGHRPCLMTMFGSACHWTLVGSDGKMVPVDFSTRCGVTFLGLGSFLTGAKTFEELVLLAENGNHRGVDNLNADMLSGHPDDPSSNYPKNILCFSFYKAQKRDLSEFRREDVARSLLVTLINDMVQSTLFCAALYGVKTILIGGNLINQTFVRHEVLKAVTTRKSINPKLEGDIYFLRHGGYLGAIGALFAP